MFLAIPLGLVIGLIVGCVGGGGAILALPALVYLLGEPVGPASTASLIVVAVAAAVGAGSLARGGSICPRIALAFAVPSAAAALLGAVLNRHVSGPALILAFVPVMLAAAFATWARSGATDVRDDTGCPPVPLARIAFAGLAVGLLTGFFGVGGGFVIVPTLALWFGLAFRRAVATSLVIITITGLAALISHLAAGVDVVAPVTALLAGSTAVGAVLGTTVGQRLPQVVLSRAFAILVTAVAVFLAVDVLALGGPPGS